MKMGFRKFVFLIIILLTVSYVFAGDSIKVGDTVYAGSLTSEQTTVRELDNNDKIEFLVGDGGYHLDVIGLRPDSADFKLDETGQTLSVNLGQQSELVLADGSKVFIKYLEFETADVKIALWAQVSGQAAESEEVVEDESEETADTEVSQETQEEAIINSENAVQETTEPTDTTTLGKVKDNWLIILIVMALIVIVGLIVYFNKKEGGRIE